MTPTAAQVREWSRAEGDYTAIPTSAFTEVVWLLERMERDEPVLIAATHLVASYASNGVVATAYGSPLDRLIQSLVNAVKGA